MLNGVNCTGKLDQNAVAGGLDYATTIFGDLGIEQFLADSLQLRQRSSFVRSHKARIADNVGSQYGGKSSSHARAPQGGRIAAGHDPRHAFRKSPFR